MPSTSRATAAHVETMPGFEGRFERLADWTVGFERYDDPSDLAPLLQGLPDDRCQCLHLGYVVRGAVTYRFADREERYEAGEAYVAPPGHTPRCEAGTELIEFSPAEDLARTVEHITRALAGDPAVSPA